MYETPELPEHVNAPERHPLLDFTRVVLTVVAVFGAILLAAWWSASWLARQTPFAWEQKLVGDTILGPFEVASDDARGAALQTLADSLIKQMGLPPDMAITVHYSDSEVANAFATLGGHVVITQGLLDSVKSENGLAMVLAHEIA
ncbi:MAG: M48 family metalloprotease, partial [Xanthomonadales bacterium]|nr:M48 family metalloprotease [Xanthomonadales bacterium]